MNWKKVNELIIGIQKNLQCQLHDGNPCGTCSHGIIRDIELLNDEVGE